MNRLKTFTSSAKGMDTLPDIWLKAAMLGSLWASTEIILGSFLHNIHMPLSGTFLAALGVILLINGYKLWPEKGLLWRTALVTAAMKSISPSAIIFGPMIGIFMEGLILELTIRIFKGRWPGFILGGALAVSWSLFQKIFVLLMTYGPDFVKLYEQLYFMASKSLNLENSLPVDAVIILFIIDLCFGALVASLAYHSKPLSGEKGYASLFNKKDVPPSNDLNVSASQKYSIVLFFVNLITLVAGFMLLDDLPPHLGGLLTLIYVLLNIARYARSLKRLKRPQLWIQLFAILGLSGILLGGWESLTALGSGLEIGFGMAVRALLVIFGFSALSIEIRNPTILDWFSRHGLRVAFEALSVAFEILPRFIQLVSHEKHIWRHPFKIMNKLLGTLEQLRTEHIIHLARIVVIVGGQGSGKTNLIKNFLHAGMLPAMTVSGFYTEVGWVDHERDHYNVVDVNTGKSVLLCECNGPVSRIQAGPFHFRDTGIAFGCDILKQSKLLNPSVTIIDEIGHLELRDLGWTPVIHDLVEQQQAMIWTVRPSLLNQVMDKWPAHYRVLEAGDISESDLHKLILSFLRTTPSNPYQTI